MIEIIATAAVSGVLTGTAIGFSLAHPWQDWTIKRINKDRADLRDENSRLRDQRRQWVRKSKELYNALAAENRAKMRAEAALAFEKARDSARTAKGNRTRKINRLAREAAEQREAA